jgi:hypothetical protein
MEGDVQTLRDVSFSMIKNSLKEDLAKIAEEVKIDEENQEYLNIK